MSDAPAQDLGYLIVGATGFLGRRTFKRLLRERAKVIVALRRLPDRSVGARLVELVRSTGIELSSQEMRERVGFIEADWEEGLDLAGFASAVLEQTRKLGVAQLVAINLVESHQLDHAGQAPEALAAVREHNERINVRGLQTFLEALALWENHAAAHHLRHVVHFSTAFVHGHAKGQLLELPVPREVPARNSYEETKRRGEHLLAQWHEPRSDRTRLTVLRPSIVTGADAPDGLNTFLNALSEPHPIERIPAWGRRFFKLTAERYRLVELIRAIVKKLPVPIPMMGNGDAILDLIDVDDVDRYAWMVIRDARPAPQFPSPLYLHLTNPASSTLYQVSLMVLQAAGATDISRRVRVFKAFNLVSGVLWLFSILPGVGAAMRALFRRTQQLRPYLLRDENTEFGIDETHHYFFQLGARNGYLVEGVDARYLQRLIDRKWAPAAATAASEDGADVAPNAA